MVVQARSSAEGEDGKTGIGGKVKEEIKYLEKVNRVGKYMIAGPVEFLDDEFTVKPSSTVFVAVFSSLDTDME